MIRLKLAIHGKLGDQGDFVTRGATASEVELVDRCFGALGEAAGTQALDETGPACVAQRRGDGWLLSTWLPSRDAVGRRYPLVAFSQLPADAVAGDASLAWALFVPVFERVLGGLANGLSEARLSEQVAAIEGEIEPARVLEMGHRRLGEERSHQLWRQAWGEDWPARSRSALGGFHALMAEGVDLVRIDGVAATGLVAFWYTAACLLRADGAAPDLVVLHPTRSGGEPRLYLGWGRFDPEQLAACLYDRPLAAWSHGVAAVTEVRAAPPVWLEAAIEQAGPSLGDLLYALSHPEVT